MPALAAFNCNMTATSVSAIYTGNNVNANGSVTITCTRDPLNDPTTLTYRIKADDGSNPRTTAPFRRAELGATETYLNYILRRGAVVGGTAVCGNLTDWRAPLTGFTDVIRGTLTFATGASSASATWGYCVRVRGTTGGNPELPTAGIYNDSFLVTAQYPNSDAGAVSAPATAGYTVDVGAKCEFVMPPQNMNFNYTSFSPTAQTLKPIFFLRCSPGLGWSLAVSPPLAPLLGLNYNMSIGLNSNPDVSSGIGTGSDQIIRITGTIPANQAGTCSSSCTATQPHTVTITF
ncbi:MAG: hypothetical protein ACKO1L_07875 [Brachymonas sp.]